MVDVSGKKYLLRSYFWMTRLCGDDTQAEYATGLLEPDEREQMHALILSFFE
jgi:hypothetical protein